MGSKATPSKSHFAHFYSNNSKGVNGLNGHGIQGNGTLENDDMRVSAGIVYRSPSNGHPSELTGSFVSATMNEKGRPASVETTIVQPDDHHDGRSKISVVGPQGRGGDSIGQVAFNAPQNGVSNGVHNGHNMMEHSGQRFYFEQQPQQPYPLPDPCNLFEIKVINLYNSQKSYVFEVKATNTVGHLQKLIYARINIPAEQQVLIFGCKKLHSNETLGHYGIQEGSEIKLECRLRGG